MRIEPRYSYRAVYSNIEPGISPVQDKGLSTLNKRRIVAAVFTVLLGSVILNPLRIPGPVIPREQSSHSY